MPPSSASVRVRPTAFSSASSAPRQSSFPPAPLAFHSPKFFPRPTIPAPLPRSSPRFPPTPPSKFSGRPKTSIPLATMPGPSRPTTEFGTATPLRPILASASPRAVRSTRSSPSSAAPATRFLKLPASATPPIPRPSTSPVARLTTSSWVFSALLPPPCRPRPLS